MKNINTLNITKKLLKKYNISAKKKFGQNFLIDDNILNDIITVADISSNELIIEIGPGLGNLSEYILTKCQDLLLVEIDKRMIDIINDRFKNRYSNYILLNDDILKLDIDKLVIEIENKNNINYRKVKVIANLPYYITSPILFKLLQNSERISEIVVMVQKEVANRIVAKKKSKDYGILTLMIEYFGDATVEIDVNRDCFIPSPNVDSAIVKLVKNKKNIIKEEDLLFKMIHFAFSQRRKKMINSLVSNKFLNLSKEEIENILRECGININTRAEELELNDYIRIVKFIVDRG